MKFVVTAVIFFIAGWIGSWIKLYLSNRLLPEERICENCRYSQIGGRYSGGSLLYFCTHSDNCSDVKLGANSSCGKFEFTDAITQQLFKNDLIRQERKGIKTILKEDE